MKAFIGLFSGIKSFTPSWLIRGSFIVFSAATVLAVGFLAFFKPETNINNLKDQLEHSTEIYDERGMLASKITANKTEGIPIEEIPGHVTDAVIAIEDHRFYDHHGIDYKGISRAFYTNLKAGEVKEGGSTITQQLTKIGLLESERTYKRKLEEFFLAREVEKEYSKDEILEMYLNQIYFGRGAWGIKEAAQIYFGKEVKDLTVGEGAMLAGIINVPAALDPYDHLEKSTKRRNLVLSRMKEHRFISSAQYQNATHEKVALNGKQQGDPLKGRYPFYVDQVLSEASKKYHIEMDELLTGGYKIYTTLDQDMQKAAEKVYKDDSIFPKGTSGKMVQSGAVLLDPKTGGIKALIGGRGKHQFLAYNRGTQLQRSPGSTIKPLAVYTPALEEGYTISDQLKDEKMAFGIYKPSNLGGTYKGEVPMYEAVIKSLNVPTVWLLNEMGVGKGIASLERFGIPMDKEDRNLSIALGGMKYGVSPLDMAGAYSAFANEGERVQSHSILKIEDAKGNQVAKWKEKKTRVTTKAVADDITSMLLGVVKYGTGKNAAVNEWEIAGKTGSTQLPIEGLEKGVKDQWFVGYTPTLVGAVWTGYDHTNAKNHLTTHSSEGAAIVFQQLMAEALKNQEPKGFDVEDIGPLIEQQEKQEDREEIWRYWKDKKEEVEKGYQKWRDRIFNGTGQDGETDKPSANDPATHNEDNVSQPVQVKAKENTDQQIPVDVPQDNKDTKETEKSPPSTGNEKTKTPKDREEPQPPEEKELPKPPKDQGEPKPPKDQDEPQPPKEKPDEPKEPANPPKSGGGQENPGEPGGDD
ncbi:PBP1A family penicillin-binding protein [Peribacillus glennii]|uniref:PBP1A family penicillin-binding protein n=1 Tax=Peribacillus glennii TaxID=2303991 RepID=A0A372L945_9BACI|nr:PBP1A family penicillin-binding protein [Peribacillus glennii]RFU62062.1 PBP1A family penicillin-binding protein [Peribacillus glennii]